MDAESDSGSVGNDSNIDDELQRGQIDTKDDAIAGIITKASAVSICFYY